MLYNFLAIKQDAVKKEAADELLKYIDTFTKNSLIALTKLDSETTQEVGKNNFSEAISYIWIRCLIFNGLWRVLFPAYGYLPKKCIAFV